MVRLVSHLILTFSSLLFSFTSFGQETAPANTSFFIQTDDKVKLQVVDWGGQGTPLVFLAGLSLNAHTYDFIAPRFANNYRVIGITRMGHGDSASRKGKPTIARLTKDIINVLDELSINNAIFAGHSFAGAELTYLGRHYASRVKGLIYIDALQDLDYMSSHLEACPDVGYSNIDITEYKEHFYQTQRVKSSDGKYIPFADLDVLGELLKAEIEEGRDYTNISAPAIAINHLPEQTDDFFLGLFKPTQQCREEMNKLSYLGVAEFIKQKQNADVAAIQHSTHMIHMSSLDKLVEIMNNWLTRTFNASVKS